MSLLFQCGHSPETAHRLLTPPVCSHVVCISVEAVQPSLLIPQYRFESFLHEAVLKKLLYMPVLGEIPLQLCLVDCCVSFLSPRPLACLPRPHLPYLKNLFLLFFSGLKKTGLSNWQGFFALLNPVDNSATIVQNGVT